MYIIHKRHQKINKPSKPLKYVVCFLFSYDLTKCLMIHKIKGPFPNTLNGIGGKIEKFDPSIKSAAYREIKEETGLTKSDIISLNPLVKEVFPDKIELNAFYGRLKKTSKPIQMEEEKIQWYLVTELLDKNHNMAGINTPYFIEHSLYKLYLERDI